jgi:hypothetical protein
VILFKNKKIRSCTRSCKSLTVFENTSATVPIAIGMGRLQKQDKPEDLPITNIIAFGIEAM